eukprot:scaffold158645_cov21-Prasinocladus_malaysianus.AAC.3
MARNLQACACVPSERVGHMPRAHGRRCSEYFLRSLCVDTIDAARPSAVAGAYAAQPRVERFRSVHISSAAATASCHGQLKAV